MSRPYYNPKPGKSYATAANKLSEARPEEAHNVRLVGHSDLGGWGDAFQIQVGGGICYVAASGVNGHDGFTVLDVSNPAAPKVKNQVVDSPAARTHKVLRINDEVLITNSELRAELRDKHPEVKGGLRVFDTSDPFNPRFVKYVEVDGLGIHRPIYDRKRKLLYSSSYKDGFDSKILLVHDMRDPWNPEPIGTGWVPGQKDGEEPSWDPAALKGDGMLLHEGNGFGNVVTAAFWDGGIALFDLTDPTSPKFLWRENPHETHGWPGAYHTFLVPEGSEFAVVTTETVTLDCDHPPAFVSFYDMRGERPLLAGAFMPHDIDPATMRPLDQKWCKTGARYGAHNLWHDMKKDDLLYICWFAAGLRIVDWSNPFRPNEVGYYLPAGTRERACPQSNDVCVDRDTGLIYLSDRWGLGLHILEFTG